MYKSIERNEERESEILRESLNVHDPSDPQPNAIFTHENSLVGDTQNFANLIRERHPEVFVVNNGNKIVLLPSENHVRVFKQIKEYRDNNPENNMDVALQDFVHEEDSDAIAKIIYLSRSVDYVIKYDENPKLNIVRAAWEAKLVTQGLILEHENTITPTSTYVKIFTPFQLLCSASEQKNLSIELINKGDYDPNEASKKTTMQKIFSFFSPDDRVLQKVSAPFRFNKIEQYSGGLDDFHPCRGDEPTWKLKKLFFSRAHRNLLTYQLVSHTLLLREELFSMEIESRTNYDIEIMVDKSIYSDFYPLHDGSHKSTQAHPNERTKLMQDWVYAWKKPQPLDRIRDYFGEKMSLYFAYLGFYTSWLWSASIVGFLVFLYGVINVFMKKGLSAEQLGAQVFDNALTMPYAAFVSVWATIYLEFWKRRNAYLSWWWNVMDFERDETSRPKWYGTVLRKSPITGREEYYYPDNVRYGKMTASFVCILLSVGVVLISVMGSIIYQVWSRNEFGTCSLVVDLNNRCDPLNPEYNPEFPGCNDICWNLNELNCNQTLVITPIVKKNYTNCAWSAVDGKCRPACSTYDLEVVCLQSQSVEDGDIKSSVCTWSDKLYLSQASAALISLMAIVVLNKIFEKVAAVLNDWENHKTQTQYEDALITKTFFFQFLNSYTTLFYIAFFKGTVGRAILNRPELRDNCSYGSCFTELMVQLAIIFIGKQLINQFMEVGLPWLMERFEKKKLERKRKEIEEFYANSIRKFQNTKAIDPETDIQKVPQWVKDDTLSKIGTVLFDDYNEMALQFGFITLFVAAFPLAPLCALINNIIEIRSDAYKLLVSYQRPPALQTQDIGSWETILQVLSAMAVITNAFLVAFTSKWIEDFIIERTGPEKIAILSGRLTIILAFEHFVFGLKLLMAYLIPDVPSDVQIAIEKERYLARLAIEGIEVEGKNLLRQK